MRLFVVQTFTAHFSATQGAIYVPSIGDLSGPFVALTLSESREFHGFRNPQGLRVGYAGVWVRVANFVPSQNPYPQDEGTGFGGFLPRVFEAAAQAFILDFSVSYCSFVIYFNL